MGLLADEGLGNYAVMMHLIQARHIVGAISNTKVIIFPPLQYQLLI